MKKKILSLAVATGLVGAASVAQAQTMHINDKGLGEALVYPFYSAANGNDTYVHLVNTTDVTKAVKVRFIEAMNSQEVLDFNLYLSPDDAWAGVITANPNGEGAIIRTVDNSCTVPMLGTGGAAPFAGSVTDLGDGLVQRDQPFVNYKFSNAPETDTSVARTLEGYIEVIEMGSLNPNSGPGADAVHTPAGVPQDCEQLVKNWTRNSEPDTGLWLTNPNNGFIDPLEGDAAGGLYGFGVVINVPEGTAAGYDAIAIDDFNDGLANLHFEPGDEDPALSAAQQQVAIFDESNVTQYTFADGKDAVSALFMSTEIMNDYVIDPAINARTDWVVTMPTKRFYVDLGAPYTGYATPPFNSRWNPELAQACEYVSFNFFDREEANVVTSEGPIFSPAPVEATGRDLTLCREVSLISFGGSDSALNGSSRILHGIDPGYNEGWASLSFEVAPLNSLSQGHLQDGARELAANDGTVFNGLPVVGFAVFNYQNGTLGDGVLSNYAAASKHKSTIGVNAE